LNTDDRIVNVANWIDFQLDIIEQKNDLGMHERSRLTSSTSWHSVRSSIRVAHRVITNGQIMSPPGVRPPSEDRVFICRRAKTSGTQAAYEMLFLHQRCTPGVRPFVESGDNVFTGSVSSDVQSYLTQPISEVNDHAT
jgi:hypothetical protein